MRVAVVGHVEWIEFVELERVPAQGEIVHACEAWSEVAGGGAVAAVRLAALAGPCTFFTALGDDEVGRRAESELKRLGLEVEAAWRPEAQRHGLTLLDDEGERTIVVVGARLGPRGDDPLAWETLDIADAVYFVSGDAEAVRQARRARVLVATARSLAALQEASVPIDALVRSGSDGGERYSPGELDPPPGLEVATAGRLGGTFSVRGGPSREYPAAPVHGKVEDAYGAGDSFAAGLTFALAAGRSVEDALAFAAGEGAAALSRRGAHGSYLSRSRSRM